MTHRERALAALERRPSDVPATQYLYTDVGVYEHGEKLNGLFAAHPGDFAPVSLIPPPVIDASLTQDGRYYEVRKDPWGTEWEYRIVGRMGHAIGFPIKNDEDYDTYVLPALPGYAVNRDVFSAEKKSVGLLKENYISLRGEGFSYMERLIALRGFEDALCDLYEYGPRLQRFFERLTDYYLVSLRKLLEMDIDAVHFGDDYGTQLSLLVSPEVFRKAIFPHLERLMKTIREAGKHIHFHSCGMVRDLFPMFEELGVNSIWPQLPLYDMETLAEDCRRHKFALAIHTDRANAMTRGTPDDVRRLVRKEYETFRPDKNGGWFYIEVDNGFPYGNITALIEEIYKYRQ